MQGYWTRYSYRGKMPDGTWAEFATPTEYHEAYAAMLEGFPPS